MVKIEADGPEKRNCVECHRRTNHYVEYGYKDGPSVRIPVCPKCKDIVCTHLWMLIPGILKSVSAALWASRIIEYDERTIREERKAKS